MPAKTHYHLALLGLGDPLRSYAASLQPDANASALLVHHALSAAFADGPGGRNGVTLEASLRQDIARRFDHDEALRSLSAHISSSADFTPVLASPGAR
ncbi:MAG TPA: hypothetical protein VF122_00145 [Caulobacteraceae bacterium]